MRGRGRRIARGNMLAAFALATVASFALPFTASPGRTYANLSAQIVLQARKIPFVPVWICLGGCDGSPCCYIGPMLDSG